MSEELILKQKKCIRSNSKLGSAVLHPK